MNQTYSPDNTQSSLLVILLLASGIALVAILIGLSEKPELAAIGVATGQAGVIDDPTAAAGSTAAVDSGVIIELDEAGNPIVDDVNPVTAADATQASDAGTDQTDAAGAQALATPGLVAAPTPTPEPEIAAAVEPTAEPAASALDELDAELAEQAQISTGTVIGQFYTRPEEDQGAVVARNEVALTLDADGTGTFTGMLDMTTDEAVHITVSMSGPLRWSSETPQVVAELTGTYFHDSPDDAHDVDSDSAELSITNLGSGTGSLCSSGTTTPTCFGFTFPPQTGL